MLTEFFGLNYASDGFLSLKMIHRSRRQRFRETPVESSRTNATDGKIFG